MTVNNVAVMRRRDDSWLNATQILKVAGVEKGKRTKVLEKEILSGKHEKVQGGYGKYQGTWYVFFFSFFPSFPFSFVFTFCNVAHVLSLVNASLPSNQDRLSAWARVLPGLWC